jgi:two-component system, NarL family, response regulator DevR
VTIRVALIDDHSMFLEGLEAALSRFPDLELAAYGGTVEDARNLLVRRDLDVALLDVRLEDGNGLQALSERAPVDRPRVLVVSSFNVTQYAAAAARFGASGFLLKAVPLQALVGAIRVIHRGGAVFSAEQLESRFVTLTSRERDILRLAMEGFSNKEIGARIGLHRKTVEAHLSEIFEKYEIRGGRIELSIHAAEEGWLDIQPRVGSLGEQSRRTDASLHERSSIQGLDNGPSTDAPRQMRFKDPAAVELGRRGGLKGGRARAEKLSAEERSEIARRAAAARWRRG